MATVTITVINDDGTPADGLTTTLPNGALTIAQNAMAATYGYQPTVPNPEFDSTQTVDPTTNPEAIPNPISITRFMLIRWRMFSEEVVMGKAREADIASANSNQAAAAALIAAVEVTNH